MFAVKWLHTTALSTKASDSFVLHYHGHRVSMFSTAPCTLVLTQIKTKIHKNALKSLNHIYYSLHTLFCDVMYWFTFALFFLCVLKEPQFFQKKSLYMFKLVYKVSTRCVVARLQDKLQVNNDVFILIYSCFYIHRDQRCPTSVDLRICDMSNCLYGWFSANRRLLSIDSKVSPGTQYWTPLTKEKLQLLILCKKKAISWQEMTNSCIIKQTCFMDIP